MQSLVATKTASYQHQKDVFWSLVLPVGHETYGDFLSAMDTTIMRGSRGFAYAWTSSLSLIKRLPVVTYCQLYGIQLKSLLLCFKSLLCKAFCLGSLAHSGLVKFDLGPHVTIFKVFLLSEQMNKVYDHIVKSIQLLIGIRQWCLVHVHCYEFLIR